MIETPRVGLSYKPTDEAPAPSKRTRPVVIDIDHKYKGWQQIADACGMGVRTVQRYARAPEGPRLRVDKTPSGVFSMLSWVNAFKGQVTVTIGDDE